MSAILNLSTSRYNLSVLLGSDLSSADDLLRSLESSGACIHSWSLASTEWPGQTRLIVDLSGDIATTINALSRSEYQIHESSSGLCMELALVTVAAIGDLQDEAASIVAAAGGRLVSLREDGFTAQLTDRPEAIEALLMRLRLIAPVESVRSGSVSIPA